MKIGLIDVDSRHFPNLALMRLPAWHKAQGDAVEWWNGFTHYVRVYLSKVFTFTPDHDTVIDADEIVTPVPGETMRLADIDRRPGELEREFKTLFQTSKEYGGYLGHAGAFQRITEEMGTLKEKKAFILAQQEGNSAASRRIRDAVDILNAGDPQFTEWNESDIRQLVDTVVVLSADRLRVCLRGGMKIEQTIGGNEI